MRVLLVTDWNRGQGGAEAVMAALRDGLRGAGDEVGLLTSSAGTAGDGTADYVASALNTGQPRHSSRSRTHSPSPASGGPWPNCVRTWRW